MNTMNLLPTNTPDTSTGPPKNNARVADDLVVRFEAGRKTLGAAEADVVGRWVDGWLVRDPDAMVVMACTAPNARAVRVDRLRMLRGLLRKSGVAEHSVRYTGDLVESAARNDGSNEPMVGTATLKVVSARRAEQQVRSIRSFFAAADRSKGATCTNAS